MAWKDIDWDRNRAQAYRKKTKVPFTTFISPALKKFLEYKYAEACAEGRSGPEDRIFKISNPIAAIKGAVKKLGYPNFTARSLRRTFIKDLLDLKIHPKTIGKTQGHQDGGMLILNTYSEFFDEDYDVAIKAIENKIN
jgi:integrase